MSNMRTGTAGRRARRRFTSEFKTGAVRLVLDEGKTIGAVARGRARGRRPAAGGRRCARGRIDEGASWAAHGSTRARDAMGAHARRGIWSTKGKKTARTPRPV